jgi:hypothetical protein
MASICELCWTNTEELFDDLDLDPLYLRQLKVLGSGCGNEYPYLLLIYTGKLTLGISLGHNPDVAEAHDSYHAAGHFCQ